MPLRKYLPIPGDCVGRATYSETPVLTERSLIAYAIAEAGKWLLARGEYIFHLLLVVAFAAVMAHIAFGG
jgi:hypothetical protein